jgi:hypothetical protein
VVTRIKDKGGQKPGTTAAGKNKRCRKSREVEKIKG